jgi:hypothetical protein
LDFLPSRKPTRVVANAVVERKRIINLKTIAAYLSQWPMTDSEIIDRLGGTAAVARYFKKSYPAISIWRQRGITWQFRPRVAELARDRGINLPADFLTERRGLAQDAA